MAGGIFQTSDDGGTWTSIELPKEVDSLVGWTFTSPQRAYVASLRGSRVEIFSTPDGGQTWQGVTLDATYPEGAAATFSFADDADGWLSVRGEGGPSGADVYDTTDAGGTWTLISKPGNNLSGEVELGNQREGWALTGENATGMAESPDGGSTWQDVALPKPDGGSSALVSYSLPWLFGDTLVVFGTTKTPSGDATAFADTSSDSGKTWTLTSPLVADDVTPYGFVTDTFSAPRVDQWRGFGEVGHLFETDSSGKSWAEVSSNLDLQGLSQLDFSSPSSGWAVVDGHLVSTSDGGQQWTVIDPSESG